MKLIKPLLGSSALLMLLSACQTIHPFNGQSGYQRISNNAEGVIVSYVLDARNSDETIQNKLRKTCAKELGLSAEQVSVKTLDEKEFINLDSSADSQEHQGIDIGGMHTSFGLSNTQSRYDTSNTPNDHILDNKPNSMKQITVQCSKS